MSLLHQSFRDNDHIFSNKCLLEGGALRREALISRKEDLFKRNFEALYLSWSCQLQGKVSATDVSYCQVWLP